MFKNLGYQHFPQSHFNMTRELADIWEEKGLWQKKVYIKDELAYVIHAEVFATRPQEQLPAYMKGKVLGSFVDFEMRLQGKKGDTIQVKITQELENLNIERVEHCFAMIYATDIALPDTLND